MRNNFIRRQKNNLDTKGESKIFTSKMYAHVSKMYSKDYKYAFNCEYASK